MSKKIFGIIVKGVFALMLLFTIISLEKTNDEILATSQTYDVDPVKTTEDGTSVYDKNFFTLKIKWYTSDGLGGAANAGNAEKSYIEFRFDPRREQYFPTLVPGKTFQGFRAEEHRQETNPYGYDYIRLYFTADCVKYQTNNEDEYGIAYLKLYSLPNCILMYNGTTTRTYAGNLFLYTEKDGIDTHIETIGATVSKNQTKIIKGEATNNKNLFQQEFINNEKQSHNSASIWLSDVPTIFNPENDVDYPIKFNIYSFAGFYYNSILIDIEAKLTSIVIVDKYGREISPAGIQLLQGVPTLRLSKYASESVEFYLRGEFTISAPGATSKKITCTSDVIKINKCVAKNSEGTLFNESKDLSDIINESYGSSTIKLFQDMVVNETININKNITIDLNGFNIISSTSSSNIFAISKNVIFKNSKTTGEIYTNINMNSPIIKIMSGGNLDVSCSIRAMNNVITVNSGGTLLLNGKLTTKSSGSYCVNVEMGGKAYLSQKASLVNTTSASVILLKYSNTSSTKAELYGNIKNGSTNSYFTGSAKVDYSTIPTKEIIFVNDVNESNKNSFILNTIDSEYYVKYDSNSLMYKKGFYEFFNLNSVIKPYDNNQVVLNGSVMFKEELYNSGSYEWLKENNGTWTVLNNTSSILTLDLGIIDDMYKCVYTSPTGSKLTKIVQVKVTQLTPNWEYTIDKNIIYSNGVTSDIPTITLKTGQTEGTIEWVTDPSQDWLTSGMRLYNIVYTPNNNIYKTMYDSVYIEVRELKLEEVLITSNPTDMDYVSYETLNKEGLVVKAKYNSGNIVEIDDYVIKYNNSLNCLTKDTGGTITILYTDDGVTKSNTLIVNVDFKIVNIPSDTKSYIYNGENQTFLSEYTSSTDFQITGNKQINANEAGYNVILALREPSNVCWSDGGVTNKTQTFIINKKPLTISANNVIVEFGNSLIDKGVTYVGFVNDESIVDLMGTLSYEWTCGNNAVPGNYEIEPKGYTSNNYEIEYVSSAYTVTPKKVEIIWVNDSFVYDGTDHSSAITAHYIDINNNQVALTVTGSVLKEVTEEGVVFTATFKNGETNYVLPSENTKTYHVANPATGSLTTIVLDKNGGIANGSISTKYLETTVSGYKEVIRNGYDLSGYYTDNNILVITNQGIVKEGVLGYTDSDGNWIYPLSTLTLYAHWVAKTNTEYKVEHYLQNLNDDQYTIKNDDTETLTGTTDSNTNALAKVYTGFKGLAITQQSIAGDGTTVIKIYYNRIKYTVIFENYNGVELEKCENLKYGSSVTYSGATPTKASDNTYTYAFKGWDAEVTNVFGNKTYKATFTPTFIEYEIIFKNGSVELSKTNYHYGDTVVEPNAPTKTSDNTYTYAFKGWDSVVTKATANKTYNATYTETYIEYEVIFKNGSVELSKKNYHYGDTVVEPSAPSKASDNTYTYAFKGWDTVVTKVTSSKTYTATFTPTFIEYEVIFKNGSVELSKTNYHYGDTVVEPNAPSKASDNTYTYTFKGWDTEVIKVSSNKTYNATFTPTFIEYEVVFKNGSVELSKTNYHYGDTVVEPSAPTKASDNTYTYTFKGWDTEVIKVSGNKTYTATFTPTFIEYEVIFKNGSVELSKANYHYGDTVVEPSAPTKASDNTYTYAFKGWDTEITKVSSNVTYNATYTETFIEYEIIFLDSDNRELSKTNYHFGDTVVVPFVEGIQINPGVVSAFKEWDSEVTTVSGNKTYKAIRENVADVFTITWKNDNGDLLETDTNISYGNMPEYNGITPTKTSDNTYTYIFKGWDTEVTTVTGNKTYTATFTSTFIEYEVIFRNGEEVLSKANYHYDDIVVEPTAPTKASDNTYNYSFAWDKEVTKVSNNITYNATFTPIFIEYEVVFKNGSVELSKTNYHYGDTVVEPTAPTKASDNTYNYSFKGWDTEVTKVSSNVTYNATYIETFIEYEIIFKNGEEELSKANYHYGDTVVIPTDPTEISDNTYMYVFKGWDSEVTTVTGSKTYNAKFTPILIEYEIIFKNGEEELSKINYYFGDTVVEPTTPTKASDNTYTYIFKGWDTEVTTVVENKTYNAIFTETFIEYEIIFKNGSVELSKTNYHYGDTVVEPVNPTKASDNTYTYTFKGWDSEVIKVSGNKIYTATFTPIYIEYEIIFIDSDNTELSKTNYHYGEEVVVPIVEGKQINQATVSVFKGWDSEVTTVTENKTYKAIRHNVDNLFTITWKNEDGKILETNTDVSYGTVPEYNGITPTKESDKIYTYVFKGWDTEVTTVTGNKTYTATFTPTFIEYEVVFKNDSVELSKTNYHYGDTVIIPIAPTKASDNTYTYAFKGWDTEVIKVSGNKTYTATYTETFIEYEVVFKNGSVELSKTIYHYGDTVVEPTAPTKASDNTYTYTFKGWDTEVIKVSGNKTYTATFTPTFIEYEIIFKNGSVELSKANYHYGDTVVVPAAPTKPNDDTYSYIFDTWNKTIEEVKENVTYQALFISKLLIINTPTEQENQVKAQVYSDEGFDENTEFVVSLVVNDEVKNEFAVPSDQEVKDVYNISLLINGEERALDKTVTISIPFNFDDSNIIVLQNQNGELVEREFIIENGYIEFSVDNLGDIAIIEKVTEQAPNMTWLIILLCCLFVGGIGAGTPFVIKYIKKKKAINNN